MSLFVLTGVPVAAALLVTMILALAVGVNRLQRISGYILAPATVCGLVLYSAAYLGVAGTAYEAMAAIVRGVYMTCCMFMGRADFSSVMSAAPWFAGNSLLQAVFWLAHLGALFVTASALLSTLGKKLLQTARLIFMRSCPVYLYFGLHEQSVSLGQNIARQFGRGKHIYIAPKVSSDFQEQVLAFGGVVRHEQYLADGRFNARLMRILGVKRGGLCVFALDDSESVNIDIVSAAVNYCRDAKVPPKKFKALLRSRGELDFNQLDQFAGGEGPIYSVEAFSEAELAARMLVRESPPYKCVKFNPDGTAAEDFCVLVIGFGQVGQHALRHIVMNGQFQGSRFSAVVVDKNADSLTGRFVRRYLGMDTEYDIEYHSIDTHSHAFYHLLDKLAFRLKYIVVSLGTDEANYDVTAALERYFTRLGKSKRPQILVNVCNKRFVAKTQDNIRFIDRKQVLYTCELMIRNKLDDMAEAVNYSYCEGKEGALDSRSEWDRLNYFSRESSRASADFISAMLHIAGVSSEDGRDADVFLRKITDSGQLLENLAITEHLRWNAFHYAMGYTVMPIEEVRRRAADGVKPIQKDTDHLCHACLVTWDGLDALSAVMSELTGRKIDYKEYDRVNVRQIPRVLSYLDKK
jgi:hypothetical protein